MRAAAVDDMARGMARRTVRLVVVVAMMVGEVKCVGHAGSRERRGRGYLFLRERFWVQEQTGLPKSRT